ncbi:MAG: hypothetical protein AMXMBFR13_31950 [Phycisphaerae bacterium]
MRESGRGERWNGRQAVVRLLWTAGLGLLTPPAEAAFVPPTLWARGQANTTYQEWNVFSSVAGPNGPDVGSYNPNGTPNLRDTSGGALLTGSGNIYSPAAVLNIAVEVPDYAGAGDVTTVILQTRTLGSEIDLGSVQVGGASASDVGELLREPAGGPGGFAVETWFKFLLPYSAAGFTIQFNADGSSMSLDRVAVDTITAATYIPEPNPVPEPGALVLLIMGIALLNGSIGNRKQRAAGF